MRERIGERGAGRHCVFSCHESRFVFYSNVSQQQHNMIMMMMVTTMMTLMTLTTLMGAGDDDDDYEGNGDE